MSKVDLSVFQEFAEKYWRDNEVGSSFLYQLFSGELYDFNLPCSWGEGAKERQAILAQYDYETLEGDYGGEGEGEYCYGVIRFQGKYYRASWTYYSYSGCDYDYIENTIEEVAPREVTLIQYFPVD